MAAQLTSPKERAVAQSISLKVPVDAPLISLLEKEDALSTSRLALVQSISRVEKVVAPSISQRVDSLAYAAADAIIANPSCELMVTSRCNMKCQYCIADGLLKESMSVEVGKGAIDYFVHLSEGAEVLDFSFTGGEPTLKFSLLSELIKYAVIRTNEEGMGARICIKTNGTLLNEEHHKFIRKYKCTIFISLDGSEADNNAFRLLPRRNSYNRTLATATGLLKNHLDVVVSMTVHPESAKNVLRGVLNLVGLGLSRINIAPAYGTVEWTPESVDSFIDSLTQVAYWIRQNRSKFDSLEIGPIYNNSEHRSNKLQNVWGCSAGSSNIAFLPNGDICGCSSLAMISINRPELVLGSSKFGIDQVRLDKFNETATAKEQAREKCSSCNSKMNCAGGCLAINYSTTNVPFTPPDIYCKTISSIEELWSIAFGIEPCLTSKAVRRN